jgi:ribosomal protein L28
MAYKCANCGKSAVLGVSRRHGRGVAGKRWRTRAQKTPRVFRPNLQVVRVATYGVTQKIRLCTKCLKKFRKEGRLGSYAKVASL